MTAEEKKVVSAAVNMTSILVAGIIIMLTAFLIPVVRVPTVSNFIIENAVLAPFMSLGVTIILYCLAAFFLVPKGLFQKRKDGHLEPVRKSTFNKYAIFWIMLAVISTILLGILLSMVGQMLSLSGQSLTFAQTILAIYIATHMTTKRMLKKGAVKVIIKSE